MPQFTLLNTDDAVESVPHESNTEKLLYTVNWADLDAFTQGYIECLFFTNTGCGNTEEWQTPEYQHRMREGQTDGELPNDVGFADLAPDTLADIIQECADFQKENAELLAAAYENGGDSPQYPYNETRAGHDFWYTRNHHGTGFWDRGLGDIGNELTDAAHAYGEVNPYFGDGDGKVHVA